MRAYFTAAIVAAGALLTAAGANADPADWYAALALGYHFPQSIDAVAGNTGLRWNWQGKNSWTGFARAGYRLAPDWRLELEAGYRGGDVESITAETFDFPFVAPQPVVFPIRRTPLSDLHGGIHATTIMANALYDIPLDMPFRPFVGAGLGWLKANVDAGGTVTVCVEVCFLENLRSGNGSSSLAWQAIAGASWPISDGVDLETTYRYLRSNGVSWDTSAYPSFAAPGSFKGDYADSAVTIGLRFSLGDHS